MHLCAMKVRLSILFLSPNLETQIHFCVELRRDLSSCIQLLDFCDIEAALPITSFELATHVLKGLIVNCPLYALAFGAFTPTFFVNHSFCCHIAPSCAVVLDDELHLNAYLENSCT
jgi:hypothetical protein